MRGKIVTTFVVAAGILLFSVGLSAHHGVALYDVRQMVSVTGTVTEFRFNNPHVLIFFDVTGEGGTVERWSAGLTSPNRLARSDGWTRDTLKPGDAISVTGFPATGGLPSVWVEQIYVDGTPMLEIPGGVG